MLDCAANAVDIWFSNVIQDDVEEVDENGDYTGEYLTEYSKPEHKRLNLSPAHGEAEDRVFGLSINYSKILTTANMDLGITEHSLVWDREPNEDIMEDDSFFLVRDGENLLSHDSVYSVVRVAKGRYHMRYALRSLHGDDQ